MRGRVPFVSRSNNKIAFYNKRPLLRPRFLVSVLGHYKRRKVRQIMSAALLTHGRAISRIVQGYRLLLVSLGSVSDAMRRAFYSIPGRLVLRGVHEMTRTSFPCCVHVPLVRKIGTSRGGVGLSTRFLTDLPQRPRVVGLLPCRSVKGKGRTGLNDVCGPGKCGVRAPSRRMRRRYVRVLASCNLGTAVNKWLCVVIL